MVWGVRREGVGGVEGGVNVAAVHLGALCGALGAPHRQPALALASATLVSSLAPYASMWIVTHPASYSQLTAATTRCIHITTQLLHTPRVRETGTGCPSVRSGASGAFCINKWMIIHMICTSASEIYDCINDDGNHHHHNDGSSKNNEILKC